MRVPGGVHEHGLHRGAPGGKLTQLADLEIPEHGHGDRARDGGGGHDQRVGLALRLRRQGRALLHAEAVLLVDHDQPEVEEGDRIAEEGVRPDDDARLPGHDVVQHAPLGRSGTAAGEQHDARGVRVGTQLTALPQIPQQPRDGLVMLLGQHLGGCQEDRLTPRVDDRQHGPQRHQRLAGANLALQQPVHRGTLSELVEEGLPNSLLPRREREGQPAIELLEQPAPASWPRRGQLASRVTTPRRHGELDAEGLVEPQSGLPELGLAELHRFVDRAERLGEGQDTGLLDHPGGQRVAGERRKHQLHRFGDDPGGQLRRRRVQADHGGALDAARHRRLLRRGLPPRHPRAVEHHEIRVGELELAVEAADPADEDAPGSWLQQARPPLEVALVPCEQSDGQPSVTIAQHRLHPGTRDGAEGLDRLDLGDDRHLLAYLECREVGHPGAGDVAPRHVAHQVVDADEAELLEPVRRLRAQHIDEAAAQFAVDGGAPGGHDPTLPGDSDRPVGRRDGDARTGGPLQRPPVSAFRDAD